MTDTPDTYCPACDRRHTDPGPICNRCRSRTQHRLNTLPTLYIDLHNALVPSTSRIDVTSHGSDVPLPLRADLLDLCADMTEVTESWEDAHRKAARFSRRDQEGRQGFRLLNAVDYCHRHLDGILALDWSFTTEIDTLWRRAQAMLGRLGDHDDLPGICPHCSKAGGLRRNHGEDWVRCRWCGASWSRDQHHFLVRALLQAQDAQVG